MAILDLSRHLVQLPIVSPVELKRITKVFLVNIDFWQFELAPNFRYRAVEGLVRQCNTILGDSHLSPRLLLQIIEFHVEIILT